MKRIKLIFLFSLLTIVVSCKKYDEGPALSFRSKKARLENTWKYEKILVNKKEKALDTDDQNFRLQFDKVDLAIKKINTTSGPASFVGSYDFEDHKEKLKTTFDYTYFGNPVHEVTEYNILQLKNKELWLKEFKVSGDTCEYHLIPE